MDISTIKQKIENRLNELYEEYKFLTNKNIFWTESNGGLKRIKQCENIINELEIILDKKKKQSYDKSRNT